jgi:hypothetical protein
MSREIIAATLGLLLGIVLCPAAFASYAIPAEDIGMGVVESVNAVTHKVVVAGQVHMISPSAIYISAGGGQVQGLQPGMRVRFIADGPVKNPTSRIVKVVVLPPTSP